MLFNAIGLAYDTFNYSMDDLPEGKELYYELCPNDAKIFKLYLVELEGVDTALRGEVSYYKDEKLIVKNVYWQIGKKTVKAGWKDKNTITVDDKDINIYNQTYDSRTQIELPEYSAKNRTLNNQ